MRCTWWHPVAGRPANPKERAAERWRRTPAKSTPRRRPGSGGGSEAGSSADLFQGHCACRLTAIDFRRVGRGRLPFPSGRERLRQEMVTVALRGLAHELGSEKRKLDAVRHIEALVLAEILDPAHEIPHQALLEELRGELGIQRNGERALVDHLQVFLLYPLDFHAVRSEGEGPVSDGELHAGSREQSVDVGEGKRLDARRGCLHVLSQLLSQGAEVRLGTVLDKFVFVLPEDEALHVQ